MPKQPQPETRTRSSPPFTRVQALENARFLEVLGQTGNARLAAREVRRAHSTMHERRAKDAAFAQNWEAALAAAHARFHLAGGKRGPEAFAPAGAGAGGKGKKGRGRSGRGKSPAAGRTDSPLHQPSAGPPPRAGEDLRTVGGEAVVVRTKAGKLQLRPAHAGKLTRACEQAFLLALSATANIRMSAAAAGASPAAFYRRRQRDPAFAREFRLALQMGYERLEAAALRAALPESHEHDQWRHCEPPPIPPMTADQALQLLFLHEKSVRQGWDKPHRRRRRNESEEQHRMRLFLMWRAEQRQIAEERAVARALRYEETGSWRHADEEPPIALPPLDLVTGWSRADPEKAPHDPGRALFGGWRIEDMKSALRSGTSKGKR